MEIKAALNKLLSFVPAGCSKPEKEKSVPELIRILEGKSDGAKVLKRVGDTGKDPAISIYPDYMKSAGYYDEDDRYAGGYYGVCEAKLLIQQMLMNLPGLMNEGEKAEFRRNPGTYGPTTSGVLLRFQSIAKIPAPENAYGPQTHTALRKALMAQAAKKDWKAALK